MTDFIYRYAFADRQLNFRTVMDLLIETARAFIGWPGS
jgi:hypothetical protein